ncbi:GNS1/SUR4 family-domain-containing protein [Aspergillus alliaceus]|uniref:Elongation of fatty acids protein n=1 Tax=Petromyces alliaceus TaxID=209559 RepID=A0A5N7C3Z2_PETAA|nr:GNS1/SUR4 family-domain-containing protein [Aspergillus alliaceus]
MAVALPIPSLDDRPFGVHLWPHFSKVFELVAGYPADEFKFVVGKTPISTLKETSIFVAELLPTVSRKGIFYAICHSDGGWTSRLVVLYYVDVNKYLELLDTIFLFLKTKPLTFLHCYHHGATAVLYYTQLIGNTAVSWVPITLNLLVHVVIGVTRLQIVQFAVDLGFVYFASYTYFASTYFPGMPNAGHCAGEEFAAFAGIIVITSYLVLFILFYFATYKKMEAPSARRTLRHISQAKAPGSHGKVRATGILASNASTRSRKA